MLTEDDNTLNLLYYLLVLFFLSVLCFSEHLAVGQNGDQTLSTSEISNHTTCSDSISPPISKAYEANVTDRVYENSTFGFKVQYPSDWQLEEKLCTFEYQELTQDYGYVNMRSTTNSKEQGGVFITINFDPVVPLNDYVVSLTKNMITGGIKVSDPQSIDFKGIPAYHLVVTRGGYSTNEIVMDVNTNRYEIESPIFSFVSNATIRVLASFSVL